MKKYLLLGLLVLASGCRDSKFLDITLGDVNEDKSETTTTNTDSNNDNSKQGAE